MGILIGLGWVMVFSTATVPGAGMAGGGVFFHLKRQVLATLLGAVAMIFAARVPLARLERLMPRHLACA
ncbi:MAG: FtsW/RodA/SpoVE family cell cycle protein, partial [bacterium]